jgi:hypothetical protein
MKLKTFFMTYDNQTDILVTLKDLGFDENPLLREKFENFVEKGGIKITMDCEIPFPHSILTCELCFEPRGPRQKIILSSYLACLHYSDGSQKDKSQMFNIGPEGPISIIQAYNLLEGRSVFSKGSFGFGSVGNAWIRIDFDRKSEFGYYKYKQARSDENYDLESVLSRYPIREMNDRETKMEVLNSLRQGNLHPVMFDKATKSERMFIEANPEFMTINIYPNCLPPHIRKKLKK